MKKSTNSRPAKSLKLFGKLRLVLSDGSEVPHFTSPMPGSLLGFVAAHKEARNERNQIAAQLWESDPTSESLDNRLKQTMKNLCTDLEVYGAEEWIVSHRRGGLSFQNDVATDLDHFVLALSSSNMSCSAEKEVTQKKQFPEIARELIGRQENAAEFLAEYEMDWVRKKRHVLQTKWNHVTSDLYDGLYTMALEAEDAAQLEQANEYACLCIALRENAMEVYFLIMRLWARRGRPSHVIEWFERWQYQVTLQMGEKKILQEGQDLYRKLLRVAHASMVSLEASATFDQTEWVLTPNEQAAARLYTEGRKLWDERTEESLKQAHDKFKEAIEKSDYALAYSGCADTLALMAYYGLRSPSEAYAEAMDMARKALRLDPDMAEGHASMGWIALVYHWDWEGAKQAFSRALELKRDYQTANHWYSFYLMLTAKTKQGKVDRKKIDLSMRHLNEAFASDVYSPIFIKSRGERHHYAGDYHKALEEFERSLLQAPHYSLTYFCMAQTLEQIGWTYRDDKDAAKSQEYFARAVEAFRNAEKYSGSGLFRNSIQAGLAHSLAVTGLPEHILKARHIVKSLLWQRRAAQRRKTDDLDADAQNVSPYALAVAYLGLGKRIAAEKWLQKAAKERPGDAVLATVDPRFERGGYRLSIHRMQLIIESSSD